MNKLIETLVFNEIQLKMLIDQFKIRNSYHGVNK